MLHGKRGNVTLNTDLRKLTLVFLVAVVSIIAIQPSLVHATPQSVLIRARGSATSTVNSNVSSSANIYLIGTANQNGADIQFTQVTGIFQIGPVFYTVTGGQGQTNSQTSTLQFNLHVGSNGGSLVLEGMTAISGYGYSVVFTPQQSNLDSQYSLWMYGNLWVTQAPYPPS